MKILIAATHFDIFSLEFGAQHRIYNMAVQLAQKENEVIILQPDRFKNEKAHFKCYNFREHKFSFLKSINLEYFPLLTDFNLSFIRNIIKILKNEEIDIIQVEYPWGIISAKILSKLLQKKTLIVYDSHDVEYLLIKQYFNNMLAKRSKYLKYLFFPGLLYVLIQEKVATYCADHTLAVSTEDKEQFIQIYKINNEKITVIPSGLTLNYLKNPEGKKKLLNELKISNNKILAVFHGSFNHFPNKEAIELIENYISPKLGNIQFLIIGTNVPKYEKDNIKSLGFVENLDLYLDIADIAIVPVLSGGGTRIKILDYISLGLPIVSTKKGIEGIPAKNYEDAIIVDKVNDEFIEAIRYLAKNEQERIMIGENAVKLAEKFNWSSIVEKLNVLYTNLVERS